MMTHFTLLMHQCFLREFPQVTAYRNGMPLLSRLRTLVPGFIHCFQTTHLRRRMIQPFKDLNKCVSQKLVQPETADLVFLLIDLEPEFYSYETCDTLHNPLRRFLTSKVYDKIIRISDESMTSALQFLVQLVQDNVGKYRRQWANIFPRSRMNSMNRLRSVGLSVTCDAVNISICCGNMSISTHLLLVSIIYPYLSVRAPFRPSPG